MNLIQRLCPHIFGWSYNPSRYVRFCRLCGQRQELLDGKRYTPIA
jgi:hypothetical protein